MMIELFTWGIIGMCIVTSNIVVVIDNSNVPIIQQKNDLVVNIDGYSRFIVGTNYMEIEQ